MTDRSRSSEPSAPIPELSVVAPMYNEEGNIAAFVVAVEKVVTAIGVPFEIILVDDGSSDGTWAQIVAQSKLHPALRGARLARNFGHQGALLAGLSEARGQAIVSMDGDLQHPPELIPELFARWREGYKVVTTERADAEDTSLFKRASSRWFYGVFSKLTGVSMAPGNSDFRLLDATAVRALCEMNDVDLFIRGSVNWLGFHSITLPYRANKRFSGTTKYSLKKMLRFASGDPLVLARAAQARHLDRLSHQRACRLGTQLHPDSILPRPNHHRLGFDDGLHVLDVRHLVRALGHHWHLSRKNLRTAQEPPALFDRRTLTLITAVALMGIGIGSTGTCHGLGVALRSPRRN